MNASDTIRLLIIQDDTNEVERMLSMLRNSGRAVRAQQVPSIEGFEKLLYASDEFSESLIFTNLVDFDVYFGHRNDPIGFANALKVFDDFLPVLIDKLHESDRLILTADHGNDPTTPSTDHSREYVPILYFGKSKSSNNLGIRSTFSDVGKTVADYFGVANNLKGKSFLNE